ncbi:MAG: hypothetical protein RSF42_10290 [Comamonas sp.]
MTVLKPLRVWQWPLCLGVGSAQLWSVARMAALQAPVLVAGGADDSLATERQKLVSWLQWRIRLNSFG